MSLSVFVLFNFVIGKQQMTLPYIHQNNIQDICQTKAVTSGYQITLWSNLQHQKRKWCGINMPCLPLAESLADRDQLRW